MNATEALQALADGNQRYVEITSQGEDLVLSIDNKLMSKDQNPFAIILTCSDSRVPVELVFHCGVGDLFVIRVAGNIDTPSQIGSIEYACQQFGTQLVVVMGHSKCGAINVTVNSLLDGSAGFSENMARIVDHIKPAVSPLIESKTYSSHQALIDAATRANVEQSVNGLQQRSEILRRLIGEGKLKIVGAHYDLSTGTVRFYSA